MRKISSQIILLIILFNYSIAGAGKLINSNIVSAVTGRTYNYVVYLPEKYDESTTREYSTVYFQDGSLYLSSVSAPHIIDTLINNNFTEEIIGVFINPVDREAEYVFSEKNKYIEFINSELVPCIDNNYRTIINPLNRLAVGFSYGGNISAYLCYKYPETFGNCGLQSAAFRPTYDVFRWISQGIAKPIRFHATWGTNERPIEIDMRMLRDSLISKGYSIYWAEYDEGHTFTFWRKTLPDILKYFFPNSLTSILSEPTPSEFQLYQNYPNPFNPVTTIKYTVAAVADENFSSATSVSLKIFNVLGSEVTTLINEHKHPGTYEVKFDGSSLASGTYFYRLQSGSLTASKKFLLLK